MERVAFQPGALGGGHRKAVIESRVMRHHNRAATIALFHSFANHFKNGVQRIVFTYRAALRIVWVNSIESQRFRLQVGPFEGSHVKMQRFVRHQPALLIHLQRNSGDLQQGVGFGIKPGGFNINYHRIKTAKTAAQTIKLSVLGHQILLAGKK